jgi:hypothetical protein
MKQYIEYILGGAIMKARKHKKAHPREREGGQGLVEMALILPFLLVLVIGIVELGVALNRQLTVVNSAREGARFGATGATPSDIYSQTLLATSKMFDFTEENAVVVVIHAKTNETGDAFEEWTEKIYPEGSTVPHVTQEEVLTELQAEGNAEDVKLVTVDVEYDHQAILGLPFVSALAGEIPIGSWTVMRLESFGASNPHCCVYPITLDTETVNWPDGFDRGTRMPDIRIGPGESQFGWIYWDPDDNAPAVSLEENLRNACSGPDEYKNGCDPEDTTLSIGDWIAGDSGQSVADGVRDEVVALQGKYIRLPIWDWPDGFQDCNNMPGWCDCRVGKDVVHIVGFVVVDIYEVDLTSNPKVIKANFIRFDNGCE